MNEFGDTADIEGDLGFLDPDHEVLTLDPLGWEKRSQNRRERRIQRLVSVIRRVSRSSQWVPMLLDQGFWSSGH